MWLFYWMIFLNFYWDLRGYIDGADAQMFVEIFFRKKQMNPSFFVDFRIDDS